MSAATAVPAATAALLGLSLCDGGAAATEEGGAELSLGDTPADTGEPPSPAAAAAGPPRAEPALRMMTAVTLSGDARNPASMDGPLLSCGAAAVTGPLTGAGTAGAVGEDKAGAAR